MQFPKGAIKTKCPEGGSCGIEWSAIEQWDAEIQFAATEMQVPADRLAAHIVIESRGNPKAIQKNNSNGWSYGLLQVVPRWHKTTIERLAKTTYSSYEKAGQALIDNPLLAVRAGAKVLADYFDMHGDWDKASSAFFLGNPNWNGADTVNGNTGRKYQQSLNGLIAELNAGAPVADDPSTIFLKKNPFPKPKIYDLSQDYARFGLTAAQAVKIINNRFENRSGGSPKFIVNHIQDGTTPGSLNWWAVGAGVQASSTVMANRDGSILKIVPEQHGPWTNGDVCSPTPKSAALRALGGNPNCYSLTLEAEGSPGISEVSYTDKQLQAILWQFADWMVRYNLPLSNVLSHASINFCDRQNCPGETNMLRVLSELKKAATAAPSEGGISQETLDELVDTLDKIVINNEGDIRSLQETNTSLRAVITALGNLKGVA